MERLVIEENERKESERRRTERAAVSALSVANSNKPNVKFTRGTNSDSQRRGWGNGPPSCTGCGHAPDNHTSENCPNEGRIFCYRCHQYGTHIGADCPQFGDHIKGKNVNESNGRTRSGNWKEAGKPTTSSQSKFSRKFKKAPMKRLQRLNQRRQKAGKAMIAFSESDDDEENVYVDANPLDSQEYAFLFIDTTEGKSDGAINTLYGKSNSPLVCIFVLDCGATDHLVNRLDFFVTLRKLLRPRIFTCANKNEKANLTVRYQGDILVRNTETNNLVKLKNVYYCPEVPHNLFSALKVKDKLLFVIDGNETIIVDKRSRNIFHVAHCDGRFWKMTFEILAGDIKINEREKFILQLEIEKGGSRETKVHESVLDLPQVWDTQELFLGGRSLLEVELDDKASDSDILNQNSGNLNLGGGLE